MTNFKKAQFIKSCADKSQFPGYTYPEFAFIGRSNVGKSSLINMILGKKNLVKTGAKPGVTRTINFFLVDENISIADLPGFGYAKLPLEIKKKFYPLIKNYIGGRDNLKLAFLLIDIRRVPDEYESDILSLLTANKIFVAVTLTKCDKVSKNKKIEYRNKICDSMDLNRENVFFSSSKTDEGKRELQGLIRDYSK